MAINDVLTVFALSDIHTEYSENLDWIESCVLQQSSFKILILAGDVGNEYSTLVETLRRLTRKVDCIFFVPGNHDVWIANDSEENSFDRLKAILKDLDNDVPGVCTGPCTVRLQRKVFTECHYVYEDKIKILFAPIWGWHHTSFDHEPDIPITEFGGVTLPNLRDVWADGRRCRWPECDFIEALRAPKPENERMVDQQCANLYKKVISAFGIDCGHDISDWKTELIAKRLDDLNVRPVTKCASTVFGRVIERENFGERFRLKFEDCGELFRSYLAGEFDNFPSDRILTYSHFLPFPFLNPEKRHLFYPPLAKAIGSEYIGYRVLRIAPDIHVFGHTHFAWNSMLRDMKKKSNFDTKTERVRFVQAPLGYPKERIIRLSSLRLGTFNEDGSREIFVLASVDPSGNINFSTATGHWSDQYLRRHRDAANTSLADYVKQIYFRETQS